MDQRTDEHTNIISQLLKLYVSGQGDDPKTMVVGYLSALAEFETMYVSQAATNFNQGRVTGHNNAFRPTPAQMAQEARRVRDKDLDKANRNKSISGTLEHKPSKHDEESKARVKAMMGNFIMSQKPKDRPNGYTSTTTNENDRLDAEQKLSVLARNRAGRARKAKVDPMHQSGFKIRSETLNLTINEIKKKRKKQNDSN